MYIRRLKVDNSRSGEVGSKGDGGKNLRKFIALISSMRLAIALIAYLSVACVLATIVPIDRFFGSPFFILPAFLFFTNLSACTVKRLIRELGKKSGRRHGPDILHIGLMLLALGGVWSFSGHRQGSVTLAPGDGVNLPDGSVMVLDDFRFERYPDGRPRDWVSVVSITKGGEPVRSGVELRVNDPLRYGGLTYYQASYEEVPTLALLEPSGPEFSLSQGEERLVDGEPYYFMAPDQDGLRAVMRVGSGAAGRTVKAAPGDVVGAVRVVGLRPAYASGIEAVSDPGYPLVLVGLTLVAIGTAWTFAQKLKEGV